MTPEERAHAALKTFHRDCICEHEVTLIQFHIAAAIAEEREACAKLAEGADIICNIVEDAAARERRATTIDTGRMIASAIRRRA